MSFILDALKQSESERQRRAGPSLADIPSRRPQHDRPWWAFAVAALLIVNLGVLAVVLLRSGGNADATPAPVQPAVSGSVSPNAALDVSPLPPATPGVATRPLPTSGNPTPPANAAVRSLADEASTSLTVAQDDPRLAHLEAAAAVPDGPPIVSPITPPSVAPLPPPRTSDLQARSGEEMLPTHNNLVASGSSLPDLRLDIHVYSPNPAERFVFVNMRKYLEGDALSEGPGVEQITADGVVLNQRGLRFLLPRQ